MPADEYGLLFLIVLVILVAVRPVRLVIIPDYERGLLLRWGKMQRVLVPGRHVRIIGMDRVLRADVRWHWAVLAGQELLSADTVSMKVSLVCQYRVADVQRALLEVANYQEALHFMLQTQLREVWGAYPFEEILTRRAELVREIYERAVPQAQALGLELADLRLRDVMLSAEVKALYMEALRARKAGQAALERARGESAALRNLLNAAQLLEEHPRLWPLRVLQALEGGEGHSLVVKLSGEETAEPKSHKK